MDFPVELLINAIIAGVLLGGFYVAVTVGVSISFGMLDIVNIAHPAFIILGSYIAYIMNSRLGLDPVLVGLLMLHWFGATKATKLFHFPRVVLRSEEMFKGFLDGYCDGDGSWLAKPEGARRMCDEFNRSRVRDYRRREAGLGEG